MLTKSPFPERQKIRENNLAYAIYDAFPVSPGHTLIISRRIVADYFALTAEEKLARWQLVDAMRDLLCAPTSTLALTAVHLPGKPSHTFIYT